MRTPERNTFLPPGFEGRRAFVEEGATVAPANGAKPVGRRKIVGIDLGTTFCAVAHIDQFGRPEVIANAENERITPSVILIDEGSALVGTVALQNAVAEPEKIVDFVKREMGKSLAQFHREFGGVKYGAEQLSALLLKKLKEDAEKYLQMRVTDAVITVPAYFNDAERTATILAGQLAGLNVLRLLNEPTAAALAYGLDQTAEKETVMVFDLGGGTFDVTLMRLEGNHLQILASHGDHRLGGKDWDDVILHWAADEFDRQHGENPLLDLQSYQELQSRAAIGKIQLSARERSVLVHSYNGRSIKLELTRADFEARSKELLERCKAICEIVMEEASLQWVQIDRIVLTGGMTRMPSVRRMVSELASGVPVDDSLSPDEAVAIGAAIQGTLVALEEEAAGLANPGAAVHEPIPDAVRDHFSSASGKLLRVSDVSSHSLGVVLWDHAAAEEYVHPMIAKGSPLPAKVKSAFGLARENMRAVTVRVVQGDSTVPAECTPLGLCRIELSQRLAKDTPVELTYSYTANELLEVVLEVEGQQGRVTLDRNGGLTDAELKRAATDLCSLQVS
jgi:molecular chaperone DnaK